MKKTIMQEDLTERHLRTIAWRIVDTIVWEEKKAGAVALAAGRDWPAPPQYQIPTSLASLGNELLRYRMKSGSCLTGRS